jgi:uncharacterized protein YcbK (DUF882 family)
MIKITEHFTLEELNPHNFDLSVKVFNNLIKTANYLEVIRLAVGHPLHINSGYRNNAYNKQVGGSKYSKHKLGLAIDIASDNPIELFNIIDRLINEGKIPQGGLSSYPTFVHYDHRGNKSRW